MIYGERFLVWWLLIKHLRDYARGQLELSGVDVRAGAKKPMDPYPCLEILWDDESGVSLYGAKRGTLTLWLDLWVRSDDKDPGAAYEILSDLQDRACKVLVRWTDALLKDLGIAVNITLRQAVSDGDSNRPLAGSRMVIDMEWRKSRYEKI